MKKKSEKSKRELKPLIQRKWPEGELTTQQKIWWYGWLFLRAMAPLILYSLMPSLCLSIGYVIGGYEDGGMTFEEFFTYGANFYTTIGTFLTLWVLNHRAKRRGSDIFKESTLFVRELKPLKALGFFAFGYASATAVSAFLTLMPRFFLTTDYSNASRTMDFGRDLIFSMLTLLVLAPVVEEIIFRGHMLNTLLEHIAEKTAILISSIVFALMHGNPVWVLYSFLLGMILAKTSMKEDNIAYGVVLHVGFNLTAAVNYFTSLNLQVWNALYDGKWKIFIYGVLGAGVSVLLAGLYTGRIDIRKYRRVKE
ncbi:MAG: CPBP family intramembrane metalloprotease [Lachnospiraceae bacterium]|nr:CPBP family intramembrane metalloprotease [Lachnospiraceae bacterium]